MRPAFPDWEEQLALRLRYSLPTVKCSLAVGCVAVLLANGLNSSLPYLGQRCVLRRYFVGGTC